MSTLKSGFTWKSLVFGAIFIAFSAIIGSYWRNWYVRVPWFVYSVGKIYSWSYGAYIAIGMLFWAILIVALINKIARRSFFSRQEVTVIVILVMLGFLFNKDSRGTTQLLPGSLQNMMGPEFTFTPEQKEYLTPFVPSLWGPGDYWENVWNTANAPIGTPTILFSLWGFLYILFLWIAGFSVGVFTRKLWVDVERLSFPVWSDMNMTMVELSQSGDTSMFSFKSAATKFFWIGFLIQFIWYLGLQIPNMKGMVDAGWRYSWGLGLWTEKFWPWWDLTPYMPTWIALGVLLTPWGIGWGYMLPFEVGISAMIGWILWEWVWPVASIATGAWPSEMSAGLKTAWLTPEKHNQVWWGDSYNLLSYSYAMVSGLLLSLLVMSILRHRSTFMTMLRSIYKEPPEEFDPDRPTSYRMMWILMLVGFLGLIGTYTAVDVPIITSVPTVIFTLIGFAAITRWVAESGGFFFAPNRRVNMGNFHGGNYVAYTMTNYLIPEVPVAPQDVTKGMIMTGFLSGANGWEMEAHQFHVDAGIFVGAASMRDAHETKTKSKSMFLAVLLGILLFSALAVISVVGAVHILPMAEDNPTKNPWVGLIGGNTGAVWNNLKYTRRMLDVYTQLTEQGSRGVLHDLYAAPFRMPYIWTMVFIGLVVGILLLFIRERVSWFRLSIAGLVLGTLGSNFGIAWFIGLILRYLTLKVGGAKLLNEKGRPLAVGAWLGFFAAVVIVAFFGGIIVEFNRPL